MRAPLSEGAATQAARRASIPGIHANFQDFYRFSLALHSFLQRFYFDFERILLGNLYFLGLDKELIGIPKNLI